MSKTEVVYNASDTLSAFHKSDDFVRGCLGPIGCVSGDTLIVTEDGLVPIESINRPVRLLSWNDKTNQFQLSLSGGAFPKGRDYLYRVVTQQGEFVAAGHHLVFCEGNVYRRVDQLCLGDVVVSDSQDPLKTIEGICQRESCLDVQSLTGTAVDYLGRYAASARQYGLQLLQAVDSGLAYPQGLGDAQTSPSYPYWGDSLHEGDLLGRLQVRTHRCQCDDHRRTDDSFRSVVRRHLDVLGYVSAISFLRGVVVYLGDLLSQWKYAHRQTGIQSDELKANLSWASPCSITERPIISIERLAEKQIYWDLQVLDTNNYVISDGSIHHNSGKSTACCWEIWRRANEQAPNSDGKRKTRWAVIRNTYRELSDTTVKTWLDWFGPAGKYNAQENSFIVDNKDMHMEVLFRALDRPQDVKKLLSLELTGAWVNEAREIPRGVIDMLQGRVGRYPSKRDGGPTWFGVILDTNPPDTDHWWYRLFEEEQPEGWSIYRQPSGLADNAENKENLPHGYYDRLQAGKTTEWIKVYVHGEYGIVMDGKPVWPEYKDNIHIGEFSLLNSTVYVGIDFGLTPAAVFGQRGPMGNWYIHSELVATDMGAVRFAEQLNSHIRTMYPKNDMDIWGDPAGDSRAQTDETTPFQILNAAGIAAKPTNSNDTVLRREAVAKPLSRLIDGIPGLLIHPRCKTLRKAMSGGYCYKRIQVAGAERFHDKPDKNEYSHVADALQYLMLGGGEGLGVITTGKTMEPVVMRADWSVF